MKRVTVLLPAFNEAASMPLLRSKMERLAEENHSVEWEFLIVDDGSSDTTAELAKQYHDEDPRFSYVSLSRNFGKEAAMLAGMDYATGHAVIIMDSDMQHPTDVVPQMLDLWQQGWQDVYAVRASSHEGWWKRKTSQWYYRLLQNVTRVPIQTNTGDFRLLDRVCVNALRRMRETQRNTKGMYSWIGYRKIGITYNQLSRSEGRSKWSWWSLLNLAVEGVTSYTTAPLRLASLMGVVCSIVGFVYLIYILTNTLLWGDPVAGYPTIMVTVLFMGGVQLLCLGIIGEYLSRVFSESKHRPPYIANVHNGRQIVADVDVTSHEVDAGA